MSMLMKFQVFCYVTPYQLVNSHRRGSGGTFLVLFGLEYGESFSPKRRYLFTSLHGVTL
jgi:hypothetical protein